MFNVIRSWVRKVLLALSLIGLFEIKLGDDSYVFKNNLHLPE
ncbi:hypothetical protein [Sodalis-like endosymbiont of Proechinophthirus fluctus]|nr:hypothetical protein [Sodalis-like endosymbiont of Proechinophthirus fluctus]